MEFPQIPEDLSTLSADELATLHDELVAAFNEAAAGELTEEVVAALGGVTANIEALRTEQTTREEIATARANEIAELASRVNGQGEGDSQEGEPEDEGDSEEEEPAPATAEVEEVVETEAPAVEAPKALAAAAKPGATVAQMKRNAPVSTRPRPEDPNHRMSIVAGADIPGRSAGSQFNNLYEVAEALVRRQRDLGQGNGDKVSVASFKLDVDNERHFSSHDSAEQNTAKLKKFHEEIEKFSTQPDALFAAGGLCAPTQGYYEQLVLATAARPVKSALAGFTADRGGIRFNPPPKLTDITSGVAVVTAAQDLSGTTKGIFTVTCPTITEVVINAVYAQLKFGNLSARAFPEQVEAWTKTALALQARVSETMLLDAIAAIATANGTSVTAAGLVGGGRELFARLGQGAAGYRSRHRMSPNAVIQVLLPSWALDLVQADWSRTFTDSTGLIQVDQALVDRLFGTRNIRAGFYMDSKTGGGQIFGAANSGRTTSADGVTTSGSATVTSATGGFTSADIGKTITGSIAGIPAGATITAVASATSITISANATATTSSNIFRIGANVLAEFPSTVYAYMYAPGTLLHLDEGTLDLGLVRDSTLNSTNQFTTFTEDFENVAFVGHEVDEIALALQPTGSFSASVTVASPILT